MNAFIKIVQFLIVNAVGFCTAAAVYVLATKFNLMPDITDEYVATADMLFFRIGALVWPVMALVSIGYFFAPREWQPWLLLAPVYVPALYIASVIVYFHTVL